MNPEIIKSKISAAEEAVSDVRDPELKKIAFERVLASMLGTETGGQSHQPSSTKIKKIKKNNRVAGKARQKEVPPTSLKLDEDKISTLKEFFDQEKPSGGEETVFFLALFLREYMDIQEFNESDIQFLYQNLVTSKPQHRPAVLRLVEIKRSLSWLVVPSRKKMWLEINADGFYSISAHGMIRANYKDRKQESK